MPVITAGTPVKVNFEPSTTLTTFKQAVAPHDVTAVTADQRPISNLVMHFTTSHMTHEAGEQPVLAIAVPKEEVAFVRRTLGQPLKLRQTETNDTSTLFAAVGSNQIDQLLDQLGKLSRANKMYPVVSAAMLDEVKQHVLSRDL